MNATLDERIQQLSHQETMHEIMQRVLNPFKKCACEVHESKRESAKKYIEQFQKVEYIKLNRPKSWGECYLLHFFEDKKIYEFVVDPVPEFKLIELEPWYEVELPIHKSLVELMESAKQYLESNFKELPDHSIRI